MLNGLWGVVVIYHLPGRPEEVQLETEESAARALEEQLAGRKSGSVGDTNTNGFRQTSPISFVAAMRIPNVLSYALAFGFLKVVWIILVVITLCLFTNNVTVFYSDSSLIIRYSFGCRIS
jgi:hypothetical protein